MVNRYLFSAHRGAVPFRNGVLVFGNDGYAQDPLTRAEVAMVEAWLTDEGYAVEGSARSADGYTWVMFADRPTEVDGPDAEEADAADGDAISPGHRASVAAADRAAWDCYATAQALETGNALFVAELQRHLARTEIDKVLAAGELSD
jgi:hypothetical protein